MRRAMYVATGLLMTVLAIAAFALAGAALLTVLVPESSSGTVRTLSANVTAAGAADGITARVASADGGTVTVHVPDGAAVVPAVGSTMFFHEVDGQHTMVPAGASTWAATARGSVTDVFNTLQLTSWTNIALALGALIVGFGLLSYVRPAKRRGRHAK